MIVSNIYHEIIKWLDERDSGTFTSDITKWDVSNITNMSKLLSPLHDSRLKDFNEDISAWDVKNVTDMTAMFKSCSNFNRDLSGWDISNVKYAALMFQNATSFNSDLTGWAVDNMVNMYSMFENASSFDTKNTDYWNINQSAITDKMLKNANFKSAVGCLPDSGVKFDKYVDKVVSPDISGTHFIFPVGENITQLIPEVKVCYSDVSFNINTNTVSNISKARLVDLSTNNVISSLDISLNFINKPIITGIKQANSEVGLDSASLQVNNIKIQNNLGVHIGFDVSSSIVPYKYKLKSNGVEISNIDISGITFNESSGILQGTPTIADDVQDKDVSFSVIAIVDGKDAPDIFGEESSVFNIKVQKKPEISNYTYNSQTYNNGHLIRLQKDASHNLTVNMGKDVLISHYTITPDISSTGLTFDTSTGNISGFADKRVINESYTINAISQGNVESDSFTLRITIKDIGSEEEAINSFATIQSTLPIIEQLQTDINTIKSDIDTKVIDISGKYQNIIDISDVTLNTTAYGIASDISNVISHIRAYSNEIAQIDVSLNNAYTIIQDEWEDIKDISNIPSVSILSFVTGGSDASYNKLKDTANEINTNIKTLILDISNQKQLIDNLLTQGLTHANDLENDLDAWKISISDISNNVNIIDTSRNNLEVDYDSKNLNATITDISTSKFTIDTSISKSDILRGISGASEHVSTFKTKYEDISGIKQNLNTISSELSVYKNEKEETLTESSNSSITAVKLYRNPSLSEYVTLSTTITRVSGNITTVLDKVQPDLTSNLDRYGKHDKNTAYLNDLKTWVSGSYTTVLSNVEIIDSSHADLSQNYHGIDIVVTIEDISNSKSTIDSSTSKSDILTGISGASEHVSTFKTKYEEITAIKQNLDIIYNDLSIENSTISTSVNSIDNSGTNFTKSTDLQIYQELLSKITGISGEISFSVNNNVQPDLTSNLDRYGKHDKNTAYLNDLKTWVNGSYTTVLSKVEIIDSSHADLSSNYGIQDLSLNNSINIITTSVEDISNNTDDKQKLINEIQDISVNLYNFTNKYEDISNIEQKLDVELSKLSIENSNISSNSSIGSIDNSGTNFTNSTELKIYVSLIEKITGISGEITSTLNKANTLLTNRKQLYDNRELERNYINELKHWLEVIHLDVSNNVTIIDVSINSDFDNYRSLSTKITNNITDISNSKSTIDTSFDKSAILTSITDASENIHKFKNNHDSVKQIIDNYANLSTDLNTNNTTLIDRLPQLPANSLFNHINSRDIILHKNLIESISDSSLNLSDKKTEIQNHINTHETRHTNHSNNIAYLENLKRWLIGNENRFYTTVLSNVESINTSHTDLSSNYGVNDVSSSLHLNEINNAISNISSSNIKNDILGYIHDGTQAVTNFKSRYRDIQSIKTNLDNKKTDLTSQKSTISSSTSIGSINNTETNFIESTELQIYKALLDKITGISGEINSTLNNIQQYLTDNQANHDTVVDASLSYINSVNEIPNLSYFNIVEYTDTDISNAPITTPINLQKPFTEFEIIGGGETSLPPDLSLNQNTGLIYGQVRDEVTDLYLSIRGTNIMGLSRVFIIEIDIAVELGGADITEILDNFALGNGGNATIEIGGSVRDGLTDAITNVASSLQSVSGEEQTEEQEAEVIDNFFNASKDAIETNTTAFTETQTRSIFKALVRNVFNIKKDNKKIKIKPTVLKDFGIPIENLSKAVIANPVNKSADVTPEDTNYSPLDTLEFIRYNFRHPDMSFQLYIKKNNLATSNKDYILEIKFLDSTENNDTTIEKINTPGRIEGTTIIHELVRGTKKITLKLHFGSCAIEVELGEALVPVDCFTIRKEKLSSSLALTNKKAMTVSKIVGEGANVKCLTKIGGPGDLWSSKEKSKYGVDKKHGSYDRYLARKVGNVLRKQTLARKDPDTQRTTYMLTDRTKFVTSRIPNCNGCGKPISTNGDNTVNCVACRGCLGNNSQSVPSKCSKKNCC